MENRSAIVLILMGPMGSGKTTIGKMLSRRLGWPFYDADDFHTIENIEKMRAGKPLNDEDRHPWISTLRIGIQRWLRLGENSILACSALKKSYREALGVDQTTVRTVYLKGSYKLLLGRVSRREHPYMNKQLVKSQLEALEEPDEGLILDIRETPERIVSTIVQSLDAAQGSTSRTGVREKKT